MSRMISVRHLIAILVAVSILHSAAAFAQRTILVPADEPTIQGAIDAAQNGDTVLVSPGTYNENINFDGKSITVTSGATSFVGAASTIINANNAGPVVTFDASETASALLNGFTVQGSYDDPANCLYAGGVYIDGASPTISNNVILNNVNYGISVTNRSSPTIQGNDVNGSHYGEDIFPGCTPTLGMYGGGEGIQLFDTVNPQIIGNTIENNVENTSDITGGVSAGAGILILNTQQLLLKSNIIRNNLADTGAAITLYISAQSLTMVQNLIYGNVYPEGNSAQIDISPGLQMTLTEINNTIDGGDQFMSVTLAPSTIENNIFVTPATLPAYGLDCEGSLSQYSALTIDNNDIYSPGGSGANACTLDGGNLSVDPVFVNAATFEFREESTSPTIAAGNIGAPHIPSADLHNKARTVCGAIDMGAYEFHPHPPITLTSSANPQQGGAPLTLTAALIGNCNMPTGTVTFYDGSTAIGTGTINSSGTAAFTTSFLIVGQHNITAGYPGDFSFGKSTSAVLVQTITGDPTTTTIAVSPNPAVTFSPITLSSVTTSPYATPNGSVVFAAGAATLATATLDASGHASTTISTLGKGTYSITANYQATTLFHASSSAAFQETVLGANTVTTLTASPNPVTSTQTVTFTATVRNTQGTTVPAGNVLFMDGMRNLGSAALDANGIATLTVSALNAGTQVIAANYAGSANFNPSSATVSETVALIGTSLVLAASPDPANNGQTVTLTATATPMLVGAVPAGTVTFYDGSSILGTASLGLSGTATLSTSSLAVGTHPLTAVLAAGIDFSGSTSSVVNEVVLAYEFGLALSRTTPSIPSGDYSNITVTVSPVGGFVGAVSLSCGGVPAHAQCIFPQGNTVALAEGAKTVTLSINTSDVFGYGNLVSRSTWPPHAGSHGEPLMALLLPVFGVLGLTGRKRKILRFLLMVWSAVCFIAVMLCLQSCSGKLPAKAAPGAYGITVIGKSTDGTSLKQTVSLELTVTP